MSEDEALERLRQTLRLLSHTKCELAEALARVRAQEHELELLKKRLERTHKKSHREKS